MNRVVVRYMDGRVLKGHTADFVATKDSFHVQRSTPPGAKPELVMLAELKAIFFVRDFSGDPGHEEKKEFEAGRPVVGRKLRVTFKDGEVLVGTTQGYQPGRPGFFLIPADGGSNIERCFVVSAATQQVGFL